MTSKHIISMAMADYRNLIRVLTLDPKHRAADAFVIGILIWMFRGYARDAMSAGDIQLARRINRVADEAGEIFVPVLPHNQRKKEAA